MKIKHFLQLIRYKNLLMLVFMMVLFSYKFYNVTHLTSNFFLLISSILFITAAGNIINDIFDVETDLINKPNKVIIDKSISKKNAYFWYYSFSSIGLFAGLFLSYKAHIIIYSLIFIITIIALFVYSKYLKQKMLVGNILISFLIALSIFIIFIFGNLGVLYQKNNIKNYFVIYTLFAFIINFIREIVKDMEDLDGDYNQNMKTLPIIIGKKRTQNVVFALTVIPLVLSTYFAFIYFKNEYILTLYILILIIFPLGYFIHQVLKVKTKKEFHNLSTLLKIIMFLGMCSILLIKL